MTGRFRAAAVAIVLAAATSASAEVPDADAIAEIGRLHGEMMERRGEGALYPAIEIGERRLELLRDAFADDAVQVLAGMQELASLHQTVGAYDRAVEIYEQIVTITEASETADDEAIARAIDMLASAHWIQQRYGDAEPLFERSLAIRKQLHGARSTDYAQALSRYGSFLWARHAYTAAERAFLRSFCILLGEHGRKSPQLVGSLISLAWLHALRGEPRAARGYLREIQGAADRDQSYPGERVALLSTALALYRQFGFEDETRAVERELEAQYREQLAALARDHGDAAPELAGPLGGLAAFLQQAERWEEAEAAYLRLIAIEEAAHGADSVQAAGRRQGYASTLQSAGKPAEAAPVFEDVSRIYRAHHGPTITIGIDMMLAESYLQAGELGRARAVLGQVIRAASQSFGPEHPNVALALERRCMVALAAGNEERALADLERALSIHEPHIELVLAAGTEADNQAYFRQAAHHLDVAVTLNAEHAASSERAARFAYTTVLRRKGRILDTAQGAIERIREELGADGDDLLDELSAARSKLAALIVAGPEATGPRNYRRELKRLETEVRRLETAVRARSASFRAATGPIELAAVQAALPEGAALVEFVLYHPQKPGAPGAPAGAGTPGRYAAYVVGDEGAPELVDLGPAAPIDRAVSRFRRALRDPGTDAEKVARHLHDLAFAPIERALGTRRHVLLAPDGALNLIPFGALADSGGRFLVRRFTFTYLTSGRDLIKIGHGASARGRPVIVADPAFARGEPARGGAGPRVRGVRAPEFQLTSWEPLPGTGAEADAIAAELSQAVVLRGERATETALKRVRRPSILHIATHGFFLAGSEPQAADPAGAGSDPLAPTRGVVAAAAPPMGSGAEHPLLRSGLVFAGVNNLESGRDDGVLTALEAAGLDLRGTRLVVLSACETGVGETIRGDGVHGLRRAFVLAGAESLVMSLWQVDDDATRSLMTGYYRHLERGLGRTEALRRVQLETLRTDRYRHPYYWASFVPAGDWTPLDDAARREAR